jgi:hypothetical protein
MTWEAIYKKYEIVAKVWAPIGLCVSILGAAKQLHDLWQSLSSENVIAFVAAVLRFFGILVFSFAVAMPNGIIFFRQDKGPWKRKNYVAGAVSFLGCYILLWATKDPSEGISPWNQVFVWIGFIALLFSVFILIVGVVIVVWRKLPT